MNNSQAAVLNTKPAMQIITGEAKKAIAKKFNTSVDFVDLAIAAKNKNVISMMRKLVAEGVNQVAAL